ncbi:hypothetical protein [Streptomyces sp. NPDC047108]|uniref:hypothetical protein n=1 Tax=Streptomyces sp. NPDC047108 TaxID=3155025 RepID=UPI0033D99D8D
MAIAGTALLIAPGIAHAAGPGGGSVGSPKASGEKKGNTIASKIRFDVSKNSSKPSSGPLTVNSSNWTPPPCWYEPKYTPDQLKKEHGKTERLPHTSGLGQAIERFEDRYVEGHPYKNFNLAKKGKGMWWDRAALPYEEGGDIFACTKSAFWVDNGRPPQVEDAVTPEVLAELAYAKIRVPDTEVELSPKTEQTVNLPTWTWLDKANFKPVSVTASLPELDISATTTATPVSLKIDPGTQDADLHPSSGSCEIGKNGSIGAPYTKGSGDKTPPCGLTYLRASHGEPYEFRATVTWKIAWTETDGAGGDLPDGTFGTTQNVVVQEVQAINR